MCFCHQMNKLLSSKGLYHGRPAQLTKVNQVKLVSPQLVVNKASQPLKKYGNNK